MKRTNSFIFKHFRIIQEQSAFKVGTDGVLLGAWVNFSKPKYILDIGTGTGLIALILAQRFESSICAIEIHKDSYEEAKINFKNSDWKNQIQSQNIELQDFNPTFSFDLIVSNPPYFTNSLKSKSEPLSNARHNKSLPINLLLEFSSNHLSINGVVSVIYPVEEGMKFIRNGLTKNLFPKRICRVRPTQNKPTHRLLIELSRNKSELKFEEIFIEKARHQYSEKYIEMTKSFYLKM